MKNLNKKWLPSGFVFRSFLNDVKRVWPGPGRHGMTLLQVGVSTNTDDITQPYLPTQSPRQMVLSDVEPDSEDDFRSAFFCVPCVPRNVITSDVSMYAKRWGA